MFVPEPDLSLASTPTPTERLDSLSETHDADLYVKRDDMTGGIVQGNKVRKLEYLLADALDRGADTVITTGGVQSNHCRATAVTARKVGLEPYLLLRGDEPEVYDGNLLLDRIAGAEIEYVSPEEYYDDPEGMFERATDRLEDRGRAPYVIPSGGSNGLGLLGYVRAYEEIVTDARAHGVSFDSIYSAAGSAGTYAGLLAGALLAEDDETEIVGVNVTSATSEELAEKVLDNLADCEELIEEYTFDLDEAADRISFLDGYTGPGYAIPAEADLATIKEAGHEEGLVLDTCYTGKAFRGFLENVESGETALFVHTGGSYGLFPKREELTELLAED